MQVFRKTACSILERGPLSVKRLILKWFSILTILRNHMTLIFLQYFVKMNITKVLLNFYKYPVWDNTENYCGYNHQILIGYSKLNTFVSFESNIYFALYLLLISIIQSYHYCRIGKATLHLLGIYNTANYFTKYYSTTAATKKISLDLSWQREQFKIVNL